MTARDRKNLFALSIGLLVPVIGWIANQLEPGQMLCIPKETLLGMGVVIGVGARLLGLWWGKR